MIERAGRFVVFEGGARIAEGGWAEVGRAAWRALDAGRGEPVLVFDGETGRVADLGPRDRDKATEAVEPAKRGRPRLGVTAREVTLLPRHWDWLAQQPGGASVALRRLVEAARRDGSGADEKRAGREAAWRFMQAMAGDLPGFEEASRALFADDEACLSARMAGWPTDVRDQTLILLRGTQGDRGRG
ncbi:DUF2239 family protein [soil metagenome]